MWSLRPLRVIASAKWVAIFSGPAPQKLLHYAVGDVSDDVRRAAITNLGFVLMNSPEQCPRIVALLAESFNPHMRYGAAMAVGLACAGSGNKVRG